MHRYLPICLIIGLLIAFRAVGSAFPETLPNFQPLAALFFCGALLAPGWRGFAIPLGIWAITFPLGVGHTAGPGLFLTTLLAVTVTFFLGRSLASRSIATLLLGSVASAMIFHLITCGMAWVVDPRYAKTLLGVTQSLWSGAPGDVLPSWVFLRNLAAANFLFTGVFILARLGLPQFAPAISATSPAPAYAKIR